MLAEHGMFGFISLFSILVLSYQEYRRRIDYNRVFLGCISLFGILTMFHSAFGSLFQDILWTFLCNSEFKKAVILYIGNILSSKRLNPPPIELIRHKICKSLKIKMIIASDKKNRVLRFLHMNYVYWRNHKNVSIMFIDVYSTKAFYFAFYFALISKAFP